MNKPKTKPKNDKLSAPARKILDWLEKNNILYKLEVRYKGCKFKKKLPFDFEIIVGGRVAIIEYDGEQHFKHITRFHGSPKDFEDQNERDLIKTKFAYASMFSILRIAYTDEERIPELLSEFITSMKTGKTIYKFSDTKLYKEHIKVCSGGMCIVM